MKYIAYLILIITIGFNLWLNFPETQILADPNDNIFQYSLVYRTNWVWHEFGCPGSLSCLPNLVDHEVTAWAEGYPLPLYYPHLPQIAIVSSYNLFIQPLTSIFNYQYSLYQYYNLTKYLLLCFFPLSVFLALRLVGFSPFLAATGAFFSAHFSTDGLYGIDPPSFLWRGYGLTSQLYAMIFFPLGIAFTFKSMREATDKNKYGLITSSSLFAALFLILTTSGHLGIGIISLLSTLPFLFFDLKPKNIFLRGKKLFFVFCSLSFVLAYWIIPVLLNNNYHIISFWDPLWKFNSYGWYEIVRQFFQGEIFDWQRNFPIITSLTIIGFFVLLLNSRLFPFAILFAFSLLLYFGRTTWGGLLDLIPGMKDFHQHRFIVGVHLAALFLIPAGLEYLFQLLKTLSKLFSYIFAFGDFRKLLLPSDKGGETSANWSDEGSPRLSEVREVRKSPLAVFSFLPISLDKQRNREIIQNIIFYILTFTFVSILTYTIVQQTIKYAQLNNRWIGEANNAFRYDDKNFSELTKYLHSLPQARIYAGRPGNWGKQFRLGSTELYMLMGVYGFDMSQFLPETWSPLSENEQNFDERVAEDYDLLNIRYVVAPKNQDFTPSAELTNKFGPFELYQVPTTGWFDVVTSPMFVKSDKTNFINIVHLWHRGYPRRWKMHPLISVEKNPEIPSGMQRILTMSDEVTYQEFNIQAGDERQDPRNIFSDFPFVFPEATVSGKIKDEKVNKQTYSATVEVPNNCQQCMIMFKMSYHPDWVAKLDGQSAEKFAVFPFYLAIPASPGTHTVEFTYQPNRLKIFLLALEIIIVGGLIIKKLIRLRR